MEEQAITISVCMIVRDEEPVLERCLENVGRFADELVIVDTGSKDATREIAGRFTDRVYDFKWIDDFAAARNYSYDRATCDYVMWLDADDDMEAEDIERISELKEHMPAAADVVLFCYTGDPDESYPLMDNSLVRDRLIRRSLGARWEYPIHEVIRIRPEWNVICRPDIRIFHRKKVVNEEGRNLRIMEKALSEGMPPDNHIRSYYCRELTCEERYEEAAEQFDILWETEDAARTGYALFFYIESMKRLKRYDRLKLRLEEYADRYGYDEMVLCSLGDLYRRDKCYEEAIRCYRQAMEIKVDISDRKLHFSAFCDFLPLLGLCKLCYNLEQYEQAREYLEKAEMICPENTELKVIKLLFMRKK